MTSRTQVDSRWTGLAQGWRKSRWRLRWRWLKRTIEASFSSSLTRRIVSLNLGGLLVLVLGFLWLNDLRKDIVEARTQSLTTQAGIIAAAIAASVAVDTDVLQLDPEKLLQMAPEAPATPPDEDAIQFSINPEKVGPVLHRLVTPTHTRARIYDGDGALLLDTQTLSQRGSDKEGAGAELFWLQTYWERAQRAFSPAAAPRRVGGWLTNGRSLPEVA